MSTATASTQVVTSAPPLPRTSWFAVVSLALGVFTLVASEFLPASLLSPIAAELDISEGTAGQLVTATSLIGILGGPLVVSVLPRANRRPVMMTLTALAIVSNVLVAYAPVFGLMLASRLLLGIAISGFWALSLAVAAQLVPANRLGRAMTVVNLGVSLATIVAIPLGAFLGELLGWRAVFLIAAAAGVIALVVQWSALPSITPSGSPSFRTLWTTARTPVIALGVFAILLVAGGHFMGYTYLRPGLEQIDGLDAGGLALLLGVFGVATLIGNLLAGAIADRRLGLLVIAAPVAIGVGTIALALAGSTFAAAATATLVWGIGFGAVPTMVQTWMARAAPQRLESAGGLVVMAFQLAITVGAATGGLLVDEIGVQAAFVVGAIGAVAGGVVLSAARVRG